MNARHFLGWLAAFALGSILFPWFNVPAIAAVCGWYSVGRKPIVTASAAAGLSWGILLSTMALRGPVGQLANVLGGVMSVPVIVPYALVLLLPALLAGAAAGSAAAIRGTGIGNERENAA